MYERIQYINKNLLMHAFRTSLADGWGGARVASIASDILFCLIHGQEPALSEILTVAIGNPEIKEYAKSGGAEDIIPAGICCTFVFIVQKLSMVS